MNEPDAAVPRKLEVALVLKNEPDAAVPKNKLVAPVPKKSLAAKLLGPTIVIAFPSCDKVILFPPA